MPSTVNGVGTWYYGKRNLVEHHGACESCHNEGMLQSYDTTLYFVFFFIPILPLKKMHVVNFCPACNRHGVIPLKKWQEHKEKDIREAIERLTAAPDDPEKAREAIATVSGYHDYELFQPVATIVDAKFGQNPEVLTHLGAAQMFFQQYADAEKTLKKSLALKDDGDTKEILAEALIKQGKTDEAAGQLGHIVEREIPDRIGCLAQLARAYQCQGEHEKALKTLDQCAAIVPDIASDKEFKRLRKLSEKDRGRGKKINNGAIPAPVGGGRVGNRDSSGRLAKIVGPALLLLIVGLYLFACFDLRRNQTIYLASGLDRPYTITLNGQPHTLPPFSHREIKKPGGQLTFSSADLGLEPTTGDLSVNFFLRPFTDPALILNPDGCAVFAREKAYYAANAASAPPMEYTLLTGRSFYHESGLDYVFREFPDTIRAKKGSTFSKQRLIAVSRHLFDFQSFSYWNALESEIGKEPTVDLAKRLLVLTPNASTVMAYLNGHLPAEDLVKAFEPALDATPVPVDLHRLYQHTMESLGRKDELRERYARYAASDNASVWKYLYARILDDVDERDRKMALLREGIEQADPSPYCFHALAYEYLRGAEFGKGLEYSRKAVAAAPSNPAFTALFRDALFAAGQYGEALEVIQKGMQPKTFNIAAILDEMQLLILAGRSAEAEERLEKHIADTRKLISDEEFRTAFDGTARDCRQSFLYCDGRIPEYLKATETSDQPATLFQNAVTRRDPAGAEQAFGAMEEPGLRDILTLFILAEAERNPEAARRHRAAAAEFLRKASPDKAPLAASVFEGEKPDFAVVAGLDPNEDKAILAAAVGLLHPELKKECFELAAKVGYRRTFPHLLLKDVLGEP